MYDTTLEQLKEKAWAYLEGQMNESEKNDYEVKLADSNELSQYVLKQKMFFDNLKKHIPSVSGNANQFKKIEEEFKLTFKNFPVIEEDSWMKKIKNALTTTH